MTSTGPPTVADLTVETLIANGIETLYCLPGVQNDPFFDALFHRQDRLAPLHTRHEQGAAYMATGAAQATGRTQAFCVVPGPGFLNATAALSTAYAVGAPTLALVGQIATGHLGRGLGVLHEIPDQLSVLRGLTKQAEQLADPAEAGAVLQRTFRGLGSGRPRPVGLEVPTDVWDQPVASGLGDLVVPPAPGPDVDPGVIDEAARVIREARAPMIVVGGGAQGSSTEITALADRVGAPTLAFRNGHGVVSHDHPLRISMPVAHRLWPRIDVLVVLGSRCSVPRTQWGVDDDLRIVHIDIDPEELGRVTEPTVGINADLADALPLLLDALDGPTGDGSTGTAGGGAARSAWADEVMATRVEVTARIEADLAPQLAWLGAIRAELPRDGIFVDEATQNGYVSRFAFPSYHPRTFISTGYQGTLGYGFSTALGAAHARPDVPVVSITGDGGALFTISELATAVHHQIPLTTVVFNDGAFGNVRLLQRENYGGRCIASDLTSPDFVSLADAYGARGLRATTPEELRERLKESFAAPGPTVIEVPIGEVPSPWRYVAMPRLRGQGPA